MKNSKNWCHSHSHPRHNPLRYPCSPHPVGLQSLRTCFFLPVFKKPRPLFERFLNYFQKAFERFSKAFERFLHAFQKRSNWKLHCSRSCNFCFIKAIINCFSYINTTSIELQNAYFESIFVNRDKKLHSSKVPALFPKMGKMGCLNLHSFGLESTMMVNLGSWRELVVYYWSMKLEWIDSDRPRSYTITKSRLWKSVWTLFKKRLNAFQKRLNAFQKSGWKHPRFFKSRHCLLLPRRL